MTAFENMIWESEIYHIGKYLQQCSHPFPFVKTVWESERDDHIESKANSVRKWKWASYRNQPWPRWPCRCRSWDPRRSPARCRCRGWTPGGSGLLARWPGAPTLTLQSDKSLMAMIEYWQQKEAFIILLLPTLPAYYEQSLATADLCQECRGQGWRGTPGRGRRCGTCDLKDMVIIMSMAGMVISISFLMGNIDDKYLDSRKAARIFM